MLLLQNHVQALNACNQRGGRMLSLVDLLEAGTVDLAAAGYLAAAMWSGASLLVGARPGGAGKTAVMCALLNFLPLRMSICTVATAAVLEQGLRDTRPGTTCYLAHEVGEGSYYAYVWGATARAFFALAGKGHVVATNLHADTLEQTRAQLLRENGVAARDLQAVTLKLYLRVERSRGWGLRRTISRIYESDGESDRLVWSAEEEGTFTRQATSALVTPAQEQAFSEMLEAFQRRGIRTIEDVRRAVIELASGV